MKRSTNPVNYELSKITFKPFRDYPDRFRQHLLDRNYTASTVAHYLHYVRILSDMMEARGIPIQDLDEEKAAELIAQTSFVPKGKIYATFIVRRFVRFLNENGIGKRKSLSAKEIARAELKRDYETYLRRQRGLSERTIFHSWRLADRFLEFRFGETVGDLSQIKSADIAGFLQALVTRGQPFRDKTPSTHLRNFFRYLFKSSKTTTNLALGILSVAQRYGTRLPRHLMPDQVETLLEAVRSGNTVTARRDYAMVLLQARLGLRASEVIAMQIDDIDWRAGEIIVRGKGDRHDRLPLPHDVGEALADYIKGDRMTASRVIFVTQRPPHRPFRNGEQLNRILTQAFVKTGLKPPAPYAGSHILRHSLATNMVQRGASIEEIGDMLRHRSRVSTMLYARLDVDGLRAIAQPWPVAGGAP